MTIQEMIEQGNLVGELLGRLSEEVELATAEVQTDPDQDSPVSREHGELLLVLDEVLELAAGLAEAWERHRVTCNFIIAEPPDRAGWQALVRHHLTRRPPHESD